MMYIIVWDVSVRKSAKRSCFQKQNTKNSPTDFSPLTTRNDVFVFLKTNLYVSISFFACCRSLECAI
jgi:hypothetical protein